MKYKIRPKYLAAGESLANVVVGYVINIVLMYAILHLLGYEISLGENAAIGVMFGFISFFRGYFVRRGFNALIKTMYAEDKS
tara:strand:- start:970 stop:1215 length:246 start_codon:yes stop_codon:yes gene_type:complete